MTRHRSPCCSSASRSRSPALAGSVSLGSEVFEDGLSTSAKPWWHPADGAAAEHRARLVEPCYAASEEPACRAVERRRRVVADGAGVSGGSETGARAVLSGATERVFGASASVRSRRAFAEPCSLQLCRAAPADGDRGAGRCAEGERPARPSSSFPVLASLPRVPLFSPAEDEASMPGVDLAVPVVPEAMSRSSSSTLVPVGGGSVVSRAPLPWPTSVYGVELWSEHYDGVVRPCSDGFMLGVDDARVAPGRDRRRFLHAPAFAENRVLSGFDILWHCRRRHDLDGASWVAVEDLRWALHRLALSESLFGPAACLRLLRGHEAPLA